MKNLIRLTEQHNPDPYLTLQTAQGSIESVLQLPQTAQLAPIPISATLKWKAKPLTRPRQQVLQQTC